jgi:hypothetical protein
MVWSINLHNPGGFIGEVATDLTHSAEAPVPDTLECAMQLLSNVSNAISGDIHSWNPDIEGSVAFSDKIRSQIALTPTIECDQYYCNRETISGIEYDVYQQMNKEAFVRQISTRELNGKLHVVVSNGIVVSVETLKDLIGSWFKDCISPVVPSHIVLRPNFQKVHGRWYKTYCLGATFSFSAIELICSLICSDSSTRSAKGSSSYFCI